MHNADAVREIRRFLASPDILDRVAAARPDLAPQIEGWKAERADQQARRMAVVRHVERVVTNMIVATTIALTLLLVMLSVAHGATHGL